MATIGVAIAVPEPFGEQLRLARKSFGDPLADFIHTHVTLIPPTPVPDHELDWFGDQLDEAAKSVGTYPLRLRGTGTFRPVSPVVFIAVSQGISYTELLAREVRLALGDAVAEPDFPFHPHVTIAQAVDDASLDRAYDELADFECQFKVEGFTLFVHDEETGAWEPRRDFDLRPA